MPKQDDFSPAHLGWLVDSRLKVQKTSLDLLKLFDEYPDQIKIKNFSLAAQALTAVAFSLWRSAFLADKTGERGASLADAKSFLGKMLLDNAINYPQDRSAREWTFNYYVSNAWYRLQHIRHYWPKVIDDEGPLPPRLPPKERWERIQASFEKGVKYLRRDLKTGKIREPGDEPGFALRRP